MVTVTTQSVLDRLEAALDEASTVPVHCLAPDEVGEWNDRVHRLRIRADAMAVDAAASADVVNLPGTTHRGSTAAFLAARTHTETRAVRSDIKLGHWLGGYPVIAAAFRAGTLSRAHIRLIRGAENRRTEPYLSDAQEYLVQAAQACTWPEFSQVIRYWVLAFDPDGEEPTDQVAERWIRYIKHADGTVAGSFKLDPVSGQALISAVEQESQRLFRQDAEDAGDGPVSRSMVQRRADAYVNVVGRGAARPDGSRPAPLVQIVMSEKVAEEILGRSEQEAGNPLPIDPLDLDGRCELIDGTPLHPAYAFGALATATLQRVVMSAESVPIDLGRKVRSFPGQLKQALLASARGRCQIPGCDAPLTWLEADHVLPWGRGGPTALANGQMLCGPHNKAKRDVAPDPKGQI